MSRAVWGKRTRQVGWRCSFSLPSTKWWQELLPATPIFLASTLSLAYFLLPLLELAGSQDNVCFHLTLYLAPQRPYGYSTKYL